jgi:deoxyribonuclease V
MDFYQLVWDLTAQIPSGSVTTYGALARALGDIRAARAIGIIEHVNPTPVVVPCHRVVYSNGGLGGFGAPEGVKKKIELLASEGVYVKDDKIEDFPKVLFEDFKIQGLKPLEVLQEEQLQLHNELNLQDTLLYNDIQTIAGIDVSYTAEDAYGAIVLQNIDTLKVIEQQTFQMKTRFPYITTYLSYHELPVTYRLLEKLSQEPDVLLFDGNGILHPRRMGLAAHAGIIFDKPALGIAKKKLIGDFGRSMPGSKLIKEVNHDNNLLGYGLWSGSRTGKSKAIYISPDNHLLEERKKTTN